MHEKILRQLARIEANSGVVRFLLKKKGPGGVGVFTPGNPPVVNETWQVDGKKIGVGTEAGVICRKTDYRFVLVDGRIEIIEGAIGSKVSQEDALKILDEELARDLKRKIDSQRRKLKKKGAKIVFYG